MQKKFCLLYAFLQTTSLMQAQPKTAAIDSIMKHHAEKGFSGVALFAENRNVVYHNAFGYRDYAQKIPLQATDIFEMASISKTFTSMIIMMLNEKEKLNYDDLVEKYLDIPYKAITIRHLLTHTSGLPDYQEIMDKHWDKTKVAGNKEILEFLNRFAPPKLFEPGTKYAYSNTGYVLLASIAEKASGKNFIKMCRRWIFKPLKMQNTDIRTLKKKAETKNFAIGHIYVPERQQYVRADSFPSSDYTIWLGNRKGPGRISSTAADLLNWDNALYSDELVKQSTLVEAFAPYKLANDTSTSYGFGWILRNDPLFGKIVFHTGDNPGYVNMFVRYIDNNKLLILLSNNEYGKMNSIIKEIEIVIGSK